MLPTVFEMWEFVKQFPLMYKTWWLNLVENDPLHVFVETTLLISIVYMILSRNTEGYKTNNKQSADRLTPQEQEELLWEWKHKLRAPLAPPSSSSPSQLGHQPSIVPSASSSSSSASVYNYYSDYTNEGDDLQIVVQKQEGKWLTISQSEDNNNKLRRVLNFCNFDFLGMQTSAVIRDASKAALKKYGCGKILFEK